MPRPREFLVSSWLPANGRTTIVAVLVSIGALLFLTALVNMSSAMSMSTSVPIDSGYFEGRRVHNIGLMQEKSLRVTSAIVTGGVGLVIVATTLIVNALTKRRSGG